MLQNIIWGIEKYSVYPTTHSIPLQITFNVTPNHTLLWKSLSKGPYSYMWHSYNWFALFMPAILEFYHNYMSDNSLSVLNALLMRLLKQLKLTFIHMYLWQLFAREGGGVGVVVGSIYEAFQFNNQIVYRICLKQCILDCYIFHFEIIRLKTIIALCWNLLCISST